MQWGLGAAPWLIKPTMGSRWLGQVLPEQLLTPTRLGRHAQLLPKNRRRATGTQTHWGRKRHLDLCPNRSPWRVFPSKPYVSAHKPDPSVDPRGRSTTFAAVSSNDCSTSRHLCPHTVDGCEIHFAPPKKPWLKPLFVGMYIGIITPGFLNF